MWLLEVHVQPILASSPAVHLKNQQPDGRWFPHKINIARGEVSGCLSSFDCFDCFEMVSLLLIVGCSGS